MMICDQFVIKAIFLGNLSFEISHCADFNGNFLLKGNIRFDKFRAESSANADDLSRAQSGRCFGIAAVGGRTVGTQ